MEYLILGNGFLGNKFKNFLGDEATLIKSRIYNIDDIVHCIYEIEPDVIINCIGKTGRPNIDWCENNKEVTFFSNVTVPTIIAEVCNDYGIKMVHIGSGCIYSGDRFNDYTEYDKPNFNGSFYSRTKIYSEKILSEYSDVLQLRIRMPIDNISSPRNLIDKLIGYKQVIGNVQNSVTCVPELMEVAKKLIDKKEIGIFNVVQSGSITHEDILEMYQEIVDPSYKLPKFISIKELNGLTLAERSNCVLYNKRLLEKGIEMRGAKCAIKDCLIKYKENMKYQMHRSY